MSVTLVEINPLGAAFVGINEFGMINAEQVKDRRVEVVDMEFVFNSV